MSSRIVQQLRHPRTGEKMHRVITDPRGITLQQYHKIDADAVRAFGNDNVRTVGENIIKEGTNGSQWEVVTSPCPDQGYEVQ